MKIVNKKLNLSQFEDYVKDKYFGTLPANKLVIHHTWKPTKAQWTGQSSIIGLKRYYEGKGWSAGPHLFIADDGIWLFTDMQKDGIHAGAGNHRSIGIEVVGNYNDKVWTGATYKNTIGAIKVLMKRLKIKESGVKFHRDYNSTKSCPGWAITKSWLFNQLNKTTMELDDNIKKVLKSIKKNILDYKNRINSKEAKKIVKWIENAKKLEKALFLKTNECKNLITRLKDYDPEATSLLEKIKNLLRIK